MRLRSVLPLVALSFVLLAAAPGSAHPDIEVAGARHTLGAGELLELPVELHYHRLVGHARVDAAAGGPIALTVQGPHDRATVGPGQDLRLNELVACCKGQAWSEHRILIENHGPDPVALDLRLVLLHDGLAVTGEDAEPGAVATTALFLAAFLAVFAVRLRRAPPDGTGAPRAGQRAAIAIAAAMWLVAAGLAALGTARYGGGPVAGSVAATADLPATGHEIFTTHSALFALLLLAWLAAVGTWTAAGRRAPADARTGWLGIGLGASALVAALVWGIEYGYVAVPALLGVVAAALPIVGGVVMLRRRVDAPPGAAYHHA